MDKNNDVKSVTQQWIENFVIAYKFCPFARLSFNAKTIGYEVLKNVDFQSCMRALVQQVDKMNKTPAKDVSNTFLIFDGDVDFQFVLDLDASLSYAIEESGYDQFFQTVVFHPDFRFEGEADDSHGNFINRSPYPMIHILRSDEVNDAIASHPDIHSVPLRNADLLDYLEISEIQWQKESDLDGILDGFESDY